MTRATKPNLTLVPKPISDPNAPEPVLTTESLYHTYRQSLLKYLVRLVPGGRQDALEILHETYVKLLQQENLERLRENPRAYIFTIATNLTTDWLRRRTSRRHDAHDSFDEMEFPSDEQTPQRSYAWEQSLDKVKTALLELPELTRRIFLLSRFDELSYPEIAHELDISTRTVERHMSTAFKLLQEKLDDLL